MIMVIKKLINMKNNLKYIIIFGLFTLLGFSSCKENIDPVIDELSYDRAFTPIGLKSQISNVTTVTLTWTAVKNVDHYVVEICEGADFNALVNTSSLTGTTCTYSLPAGDTQFSARIKSVSSVEGIAESNWTTVSFKTDPENLFTGYPPTMTGIGALTIKWTPGKAVTKLLFTNNGVDKSFDISAAEATAGSKSVTGLTNGTNQIQILNGNLVRGKQSYALEGDVYLDGTGDLVAAVAALKAGGVIILAPGANLGYVGPINLTKSIKIRGLNSTSRPTLYVTTYPSLAHMFNIGSTLTNADSIVFQDVNLSGYINNVVGTAKTRGVFDQQDAVACAVGSIKFINCNIKNFERHLVRLRGNVAQVIGTIEINNCILTDFAFASNYGVINSSAAPGTINNIKISNTTIYNIRGAIISYTSGTACQGISITNCTFNQLAQDATTARYVIDLNNTVSTGNLTISNCIFGNTLANCAGFRTNTMVLTMPGSYFTSDFNDPTLTTVKSKMTPYTGASTALWTDPLTGIFTIKDAAFVGKATAGDPRWK